MLSPLDLDIRDPKATSSPEANWQRIMWGIEPGDDRAAKFGIVRYAVPPPGWKTVKSARPLEPGQLYEVEMTLFACFGQKPNGVCRVYSWDEYWDLVRRKAQPNLND
jgi:hypothetical protein